MVHMRPLVVAKNSPNLGQPHKGPAGGAGGDSRGFLPALTSCDDTQLVVSEPGRAPSPLNSVPVPTLYVYLPVGRDIATLPGRLESCQPDGCRARFHSCRR